MLKYRSLKRNFEISQFKSLSPLLTMFQRNLLKIQEMAGKANEIGTKLEVISN